MIVSHSLLCIFLKPFKVCGTSVLQTLGMNCRDGDLVSAVSVRQWVISVPKRLRCILADWPQAMTLLSRIFLDEIERLLCDAAGVPVGSGVVGQTRPRLGAVSF